MKSLRFFAVVFIVGFAAYTYVFSTTVRYRLTLEADVGGERKHGSSVVEVTYSKNNDPISRAEFTIDFRGEAVILDLGARGALFALLKGDTDSRSGPEYIVFRAFNLPGGAMPSPIMHGLSVISRLAGKVDLPLTSLPLLVRFRDLKDPMSVERVDPLDIAKSFGAGTKLVRATLEIVPTGIWPLNRIGLTGESTATEIEKRLTWLRGLGGGYLDGGFSSINAPLGLYGGDFKRR
jgi:hypothetical protein